MLTKTCPGPVAWMVKWPKSFRQARCNAPSGVIGTELIVSTEYELRIQDSVWVLNPKSSVVYWLEQSDKKCIHVKCLCAQWWVRCMCHWHQLATDQCRCAMLVKGLCNAPHSTQRCLALVFWLVAGWCIHECFKQWHVHTACTWLGSTTS